MLNAVQLLMTDASISALGLQATLSRVLRVLIAQDNDNRTLESALQHLGIVGGQFAGYSNVS